MTEKVLEKARSKKAVFKTYQTKIDDCRKYVRFRNQSRLETRKAKRDFKMKIAKDAKENPKAFYNFVDNRLKVQVADLEIESGMATTDKDKARALNKFFCGVFIRESDNEIPQLERRPSIDTQISEVTITTEEVNKRIMEFKTSKSPGPDGLHPRVRIELHKEVSPPIT